MTPGSILIVEDENIVSSLYRRLLTPLGYAPVFAASVAEAVKVLEGLANLDLLVTDICLPDGDGTEVIRRVRKKFPSAGVLVITGLPPGEISSEAAAELKLLEEDIMFKPVDIALLEKEVRRRVPAGNS